MRSCCDCGVDLPSVQHKTRVKRCAKCRLQHKRQRGRVYYYAVRYGNLRRRPQQPFQCVSCGAVMMGRAKQMRCAGCVALRPVIGAEKIQHNICTDCIGCGASIVTTSRRYVHSKIRCAACQKLHRRAYGNNRRKSGAAKVWFAAYQQRPEVKERHRLDSKRRRDIVCRDPELYGEHRANRTRYDRAQYAVLRRLRDNPDIVVDYILEEMVNEHGTRNR